MYTSFICSGKDLVSFGGRRVRSISNLVAVLILLAIVVGVGVAIAMMSGALTQRLQPTSSSLNIQSVRVQALTSNKQYIVAEIAATVTGAQGIRINNIWLYWESGGNLMSVARYSQQPSSAVYFTPGTTITIQGWFNLGSLPKPADYAPVRVVIQYCDVTGSCSQISGSGTLEPYKP
jgi:hypothetical protein